MSKTMQYAFLIYSNEETEPKIGTEEQAALMQGFFKFTEEVKSKQIMLAGEPLEPVATATTVRVRDGKQG